jgi:hypothetical protein
LRPATFSAAFFVALSAPAAAPFFAPSGLVPSGLRSALGTRARLGLASVASAASLSTPVSAAAWSSALGSAFFARARLGLI